MAPIIIILLVFFIHLTSHLFSGLIKLAFEWTLSWFSNGQKSALPNLQPVIPEELLF